jgi:hypothetical protein
MNSQVGSFPQRRKKLNTYLPSAIQRLRLIFIKGHFSAEMKHRTLRVASDLLGILAVVYLVAGVVVSVIVGMGAATAMAKIGFVAGGFIITAFSVIMLLAVSRLILLLVSVEEHLGKLAAAVKDNKGD